MQLPFAIFAEKSSAIAARQRGRGGGEREGVVSLYGPPAAGASRELACDHSARPGGRVLPPPSVGQARVGQPWPPHG